jgi:hypothetical protein
MMRDQAEKTLSDATQRRSSTALAVQHIGRLIALAVQHIGRLMEAFLTMVPEAACEALSQRVFRAKEGLMPSSLRLV